MSVYVKSIITRKVAMPVARIGPHLLGALKRVLSSELDGKCTVEGFVKPRSIDVLTHSCGLLKNETVVITVVFECDIANPLPGQVFECLVEHNTHAGLKCKLTGADSPFVIFVARDHHHTLGRFAAIKEGDTVSVMTVGQRFEMNDTYISIIATLSDAYTGPDDDELFTTEIVESPKLPEVHSEEESEESSESEDDEEEI